MTAGHSTLIQTTSPDGGALSGSRYGRALDRAGVVALVAAASVGFGTNLSIQLINLALHANGADTAVIGLSTMSQAIGIVIGAALASHVMAHVGVGRTLAAGSALAGVTMAAMAHSADIAVLTLLRSVYAVGLAFVFACSEYVILSRAADGSRGHASGLYVTVVGIGMALGPLWIAIIGIGSGTAYYSGTLLCFLCVPLAWSLLGEIAAPPPSKAGPGAPLLRLAPLGFLAAFLFGFIDNGPVSLLSVWSADNGWPPVRGALLVSAATIGAIVFQVPIGRTVDRLGAVTVFRLGLLASVLFVVLLAQSWGNPLATIVLVVALGAAMEGFYTVGLADIAQRVPALELSGANAYFIAMCGAGEIVGPLVTGLAIGSFG